MMIENKEIDDLQAELRELRSKLQANISDIGDWKIIKALEYQLIWQEIPYHINKLNNERQAIRERINQIENIILKENYVDESIKLDEYFKRSIKRSSRKNRKWSCYGFLTGRYTGISADYWWYCG